MTRKQAKEVRERAAEAAERVVKGARDEAAATGRTVPAERYETLRATTERTYLQMARARFA